MINPDGWKADPSIPARAWELSCQLEERLSALRRDAQRLRAELDQMKEMTLELRQDTFNLRRLREASRASKKCS